jgi:hypothetical protein
LAGGDEIISIHALHAECDFDGRPMVAPASFISIHALHAECDRSLTQAREARLVFQSTHSMRSATAIFRK